jgi:DNA-directed RNA polymerase subunit M
MEFCDDCGSMMTAEDDVWRCTSCGTIQPKEDAEAYVTTQSQEVGEVIETEATGGNLPTTEADCPSCDNDRAGWYMQQIRAADESETRFFVCTECGHKWREDDH